MMVRKRAFGLETVTPPLSIMYQNSSLGWQQMGEWKHRRTDACGAFRFIFCEGHACGHLLAVL